MFDILEKMDAGIERHERFLAEAEQYRRFQLRGVTQSPLREAVHRILMAVANLMIGLGTRLKATLPTSDDMPTSEALCNSCAAN